jgi:L-ribulose-5-phosphate 3-epimerase
MMSHQHARVEDTQATQAEVSMSQFITRREFINATVATLAISALPRSIFAESPTTAPAAFSTQRYKVAACDWMMLKRQKLGAFQLAKDCGLDGLEVDMGSLSKNPTFASELANPEVREQFIGKSRELGIEISSIAMSGFYAQSFTTRDVETPINDAIETAKLMGVKVTFLPLGVQADLIKFPELRPQIIERIKTVAPNAEKAGITIGLETALDAAGDVKLLDEIGSPAVRIYFNFSNALQNDRDLYSELKTLGKDRICQIHCTDQDGVWLENDPKIDMKKAKATLDEMGWSGWLVLERSRDAKKSRDTKYNFGGNGKYVKSIFQTT